jgi:glycosyltransferase involved in cell wall biosynthesis
MEVSAKRGGVNMKQRILLIADTPGWAFDRNMQDMAKYCHEFSYDFWYLRDGPPPECGYDAIYTCWHLHYLIVKNDGLWMPPLPDIPVFGSLRSSLWDNTKEQENISADNIDVINHYCAFHFVIKNMYNRVKRYCPRLVYLTNPVDHHRFSQTEEKSVVACWAGNVNHASCTERDAKGFYSIVLPACSDAKVTLSYAEYNTNRYSYEQMPEFYRRASVYLSGAAYEGAGNSIMEAMASGLVVITTNTGNASEMRSKQLHDYGDTGIIIVPRERACFSSALNALIKNPSRMTEMGNVNRRSVIESWSWDVWRDKYVNFFRMGL